MCLYSPRVSSFLKLIASIVQHKQFKLIYCHLFLQRTNIHFIITYLYRDVFTYVRVLTFFNKPKVKQLSMHLHHLVLIVRTLFNPCYVDVTAAVNKSREVSFDQIGKPVCTFILDRFTSIDLTVFAVHLIHCTT